MTSILSALLGALIVLSLIALARHFTSFTAQRPADYAGGPAFDLRQHLSGPMVCEGVIFGPTGRVTSRFVADMLGSWTGPTGTLSEVFRYDSGTVGYLEFLDAERTRLQTERQANQVTAQRFISTVRLIKAMGGGW